LMKRLVSSKIAPEALRYCFRDNELPRGADCHNRAQFQLRYNVAIKMKALGTGWKVLIERARETAHSGTNDTGDWRLASKHVSGDRQFWRVILDIREAK
jgi:hypothetical protein